MGTGETGHGRAKYPAMKPLKSFHLWLSENDDRPHANGRGGIAPQTPEEVARFKHADLITLPVSVEGTNCGNCKFVSLNKAGAGHCAHPEVRHEVNRRMCCKFWDNSGVKRQWRADGQES
jgi:hypothetical protein